MLDRRYTIVTNHKTLKYNINKANVEGRITRFKLIVADFDYTIEYQPCKKHANADLMFQAYDEEVD